MHGLGWGGPACVGLARLGRNEAGLDWTGLRLDWRGLGYGRNGRMGRARQEGVGCMGWDVYKASKKKKLIVC